MPNRSGRAAAKRAKMRDPRAKQRRNPKGGVGALPEWDLSDLYAGVSSPEIARDLARADALCLAFEERCKGKLAALARSPDGGKALAAAVEEFESIDDLIGRIASFAGLIHSADTTDPVRAKFFGDVQERITTSSSHLLFFALELNKIDDGVLENAMAHPALGHYRPWIEDIRREKPYQLEDRIEQLFHEKSVTGQGAWNRLFADIADARHLANRVEREVVEALVKAVGAAYPRLSHRYYALKARWFGKKRLPYWDRNAPLPDVPSHPIPWHEAEDTVLSAYRAFSPVMADIAERFFSRRWIDAPVRPGKAPGAFSHPTVPSLHPFILLNYQGKPRDVMTLAHELGHGVHQVLAAPNGALMAPTPLTLAETASVFGEMLTFRRLLAAATNAKQRKAMLASKVEDMINTVIRQIAFYTFERCVHSERRNGELTAERLCQIWLEVQRESLGPAIDLKAGYESFWVYIGHFVHSPFYVYAYAFGDCLVNALYAVYEKAHEGFAERYLAMLAAGGTKHHAELLKPFGLDAREPAFWQGGLRMIEGMIDELEGLG